MWHKADFKVGPVTGPKPTRLRQGKKYLRPRQHSPFQRKITSDYLSHVQTTHEDGTRPFSRWVRSQGRSQHASGKARNTFDPVGIPIFKGKYLSFFIIYGCVPPTHEYGTRPFLMWVQSHGRSPHASDKAKNAFDPVGIPLFKGKYLLLFIIYRCVPPTHEYGTRPFLSWVRSQGRSPHASGKAQNIFDPVGIPLFKGKYLLLFIIYRCVPPTHEYGTRLFLSWVQLQGRSPHASGKAKNTFDPVGIPLFKGKYLLLLLFIDASHQPTNMAQGRF